MSERKAVKKAVRTGILESDVDITLFTDCNLEALMKAQAKGYKIAELPVKIINNDNEGTKVRVIKDTLEMLNDIRKIKKQN